MKRKSIIENHTQHIRNKLKTNLNEYYEQSTVAVDPYAGHNIGFSEKWKEEKKSSESGVGKILSAASDFKQKAGGIIDKVQGVADIVSTGLSFIPGLNLVGSAIDAVSAGVDTAQGQYGDAAMRAGSAAAGVVPGGGAAVKGGRLLAKATGAVSGAVKGVGAAVDAGKAGINAVRAAGQASKAAQTVSDAGRIATNTVRRQQGLAPISSAGMGAIEGSARVLETYNKIYKTLLEKLNVNEAMFSAGAINAARRAGQQVRTFKQRPGQNIGANRPAKVAIRAPKPVPKQDYPIVPYRKQDQPIVLKKDQPIVLKKDQPIVLKKDNPIVPYVAPVPTTPPQIPTKTGEEEQSTGVAKPSETKQTVLGTDLIGPQIGQFAPATQWELQSIGQAEKSNPSNANNPMYSRQRFAQISQMGESFDPIKRKVKVAVSSYLKSKHGKQLNNHLENIRQGLQKK